MAILFESNSQTRMCPAFAVSVANLPRYYESLFIKLNGPSRLAEAFINDTQVTPRHSFHALVPNLQRDIVEMF
jgi:hypothetical protein